MMKKDYLSLIVVLAISSLWASRAVAIDVEVSEAPTTDLSLIVSAIQGAQSSIYMNIYELSSPQIADAITERIQAGVHVEILEEGQPVGGMSAASKGIETQIVQEMHAADHFYEMTSKPPGLAAGAPSVKRRFRYDHAKYTIIDEDRLVIGSENYSPTGNAVPGTLGNRGWEVLIHDPALALQFKATFLSDSSTQTGDVTEITAGKGTSSKSEKSVAPAKSDDTNPVLSASAVKSFMSPTTSEAGLVALIKSARKSLDIEQMTFNSTWRTAPGNSPLYDAVIAAAQKGVQVRILLNDERVFDHPSAPSKPVNRVTFANLNALATKNKLPLSVRIANIQAMNVDYIHNKGALVDGKDTLVSSINWGENAVEGNRETAVVITSPAVNAHYSSLFTQDWNNSETPGADPTPGSGPDDPQMLQLLNTTVDTSCPTAVTLQVQIGALALTSADDPDFRSLSSTAFSGNFVREASESGCILTQTDQSASEVAAKRFMEIKTGYKDGSKAIVLEGYTPISQKLYSIRVRVAPGSASIAGQWNAQVYDASSAKKESIGTASINLAISQQ
jgi:phosphatidylserine/phosphatidylglycerophosphate/cardiolipin synthase-like enzyme